MRNQPKYSFFKNSSYAIEGIIEVFKNETAFKIEAVFFIFSIILMLFLNIPLWSKIALPSSIFIVFIAEMFNSSIERVVDLASPNRHPLAKRSKDAASAGVFFSILLTTSIWICIFLYLYQKGYF